MDILASIERNYGCVQEYQRQMSEEGMREFDLDDYDDYAAYCYFQDLYEGKTQE